MGSFPQVDPRYCEVLASRQVPHKEWHEHQKWVRYYLHFCNKYRHVPDDPESIPLFIGKLASKNQTSAQQGQARRAIEFYFVLLSPKPPCPQRAVSDVPAASDVKGNFTVVKKQDAVSHYHQVSKGETDYCLPENREKLACSHMHMDSVIKTYFFFEMMTYLLVTPIIFLFCMAADTTFALKRSEESGA